MDPPRLSGHFGTFFLWTFWTFWNILNRERTCDCENDSELSDWYMYNCSCIIVYVSHFLCTRYAQSCIYAWMWHVWGALGVKQIATEAYKCAACAQPLDKLRRNCVIFMISLNDAKNHDDVMAVKYCRDSRFFDPGHGPDELLIWRDS